MNKCNSCGAIFDDDKIKYKREWQGEFGGSPYYEPLAVCPECGYDQITEVEQEDLLLAVQSACETICDKYCRFPREVKDDEDLEKICECCITTKFFSGGWN